MIDHGKYQRNFETKCFLQEETLWYCEHISLIANYGEAKRKGNIDRFC